MKSPPVPNYHLTNKNLNFTPKLPEPGRFSMLCKTW